MAASFARNLDIGNGAPSVRGLFAAATFPPGASFGSRENWRTAESDTGESLDTFELEPGQTSFAQRIRNLVNAGKPYEAICLLQNALSAATELSIENLLDLATEAMDMMNERGQFSEARLLGELAFTGSASDPGQDYESLIHAQNVGAALWAAHEIWESLRRQNERAALAAAMTPGSGPALISESISTTFLNDFERFMDHVLHGSSKTPETGLADNLGTWLLAAMTADRTASIPNPAPSPGAAPRFIPV
jgi:hypothetical protein